jgi:F-type H+-transporting ATPase subunit alpha
VLKQGQFQPMPIENQIVVLYAATRGYLDKMSVSSIPRFEQAILQEISPEILSTIREKRVISDELNSSIYQRHEKPTQRYGNITLLKEKTMRTIKGTYKKR